MKKVFLMVAAIGLAAASFADMNDALLSFLDYDKLKEGKCLHLFGTSEYLFDVTDEQAETFLAQMPNAIESFKKFPEDWQERVEKRKARKMRKKSTKK